MSYLEKLLAGAEMEWKDLGEVAVIGTGSHDTQDAVDDGKYTFYARGIEPLRLNSYDFDETAIVTAGDGVGVGKVFHWVVGKYALHQRAYRIVPNATVNTRYVYHYMVANFEVYIKKASVHSSVTSLRRPMFLKFPVPIPSLEIQQKIVAILDTFTGLTAGLTAELTAELTARKKQYSYYREKLLDFSGEELVVSGQRKVEWKTIKEIADNYTGLTYKPSDIATEGTLVLRSSNIKGSTLSFENNVFVKMDKIPDRAIARENDILVCVRNGSKALIGKAAVVPKTTEIMAFGAFMTILRAKQEIINYRYLFHIWQSSKTQLQIKGDDSMPINQITNKEFARVKVPVPSLEEQARIVTILDKFYTLTNSISEGLPKEIELRKKQYEYYREMLLAFPKDNLLE